MAVSKYIQSVVAMLLRKVGETVDGCKMIKIKRKLMMRSILLKP